MKVDPSLQKLIANFFNMDLNDINAKSSKDNIEEWDSLEHIKLILEIEDKYHVKFALDVVPSMTSVKAIQEELNKIRK